MAGSSASTWITKRVYFNGRSPGFTSYFGRYPDDELCIIVLANNYIPLATQIGGDIAAICFHEKYEQPKMNSDKLAPDAIKGIAGQYQFDENFYRPKMLMTIKEKDGLLSMDWGALIPNGPMKYIDRTYWLPVEFVKDSSGKISLLNYGNFRGIRKN